MKAWHWVGKDRILRYGDGRIVAPDYTYYDDCTPKLCEIGLHASKNILDSLNIAPGPICCRVEISGKIIHGNDKLVGTERTVLWMVDAEDILREFARMCALDAIHLWDAPKVVIDYLKTGDEKLRAAARDAARDAAWDAASTSAAYAAWAAARAAARAATWDAASTSAARDAAWGAARDAARAAARAAARDAQNKRLVKMITQAKRLK